jgi:hypothetical protein
MGWIRKAVPGLWVIVVTGVIGLLAAASMVHAALQPCSPVVEVRNWSDNYDRINSASRESSRRVRDDVFQRQNTTFRPLNGSSPSAVNFDK